MSMDEVIKYWIPAVKAIYGRYEASPETCLALGELLGIDEYQQYIDAFPVHLPLTEDMKKLLVLLAGPHSKAILKAYRIQKGLE